MLDDEKLGRTPSVADVCAIIERFGFTKETP
jgi:hypothetical protein